MSPTDMAREIAIKRGMASLLYKRKRQLDGQPTKQRSIMGKIGKLNRQASRLEKELDRLATVDE